MIAEKENSAKSGSSPSASEKSQSKRTPSRGKGKMATKSELFEFEGRFSALEAKLDKFLTCVSGDGTSGSHEFSRQPVEVETVSVTRRPNATSTRPLISIENSLNRDYGLEHSDGLADDEISVQVSDTERRNSGFCEDSMSISSEHVETDNRFSKYVTTEAIPQGSVQDRKLLSVFGEDATTKTEKSKVGIILDDAQKTILQQSYRSEHPDRISSYKDSYRHAFPVHDSCEDWFKVPTLDETVESLLVKKYGHRAAFGHVPSLFGKSMKSMERLAFQGQMAARMGMIMCCYTQQTLAGLLSLLQSNETNIDLAIQMVRDIFAISTKTLDQVSRVGAFNHMIRRKATLYDTGLAELKDYTSTVNALPLTAAGVFGPDFDLKLKAKVEKNKQLAEVLPDSLFKQKPSSSNSVGMYNKRKSYASSDQAQKRPRFEDRQGPSTSNQPARQFSGGFKIPRLQPSRDGQRKVSSFRNSQTFTKA